MMNTLDSACNQDICIVFNKSDRIQNKTVYCLKNVPAVYEFLWQCVLKLALDF